MNRFLGSSKPKAPAPTLGDQQGLQQKRIDDLQGRVRKLDSELVKYREPGGAEEDVAGHVRAQQREAARDAADEATTYDERCTTSSSGR